MAGAFAGSLCGGGVALDDGCGNGGAALGGAGVLAISGCGGVVDGGGAFGGSIRGGGVTGGVAFLTGSCCAVDGGIGEIICSGCVFSRLCLISVGAGAGTGAPGAAVFSNSICAGADFETGGVWSALGTVASAGTVDAAGIAFSG